MGQSGLDEFRGFVRDFQSLPALGAKGAVLIPLADLVAQVGPPWPPGLAVMTSVTQLLVLILLFQLWHDLPEHRVERRIKVGAGVLVIMFFLYLGLSMWLVVTDIPGGGRAVEGFIVRPDVQEILASGISSREALAGAEYDPHQVWTRRSIIAANLSLVGVWLTIFACLTVTTGAFVLHQRKRPQAP